MATKATPTPRTTPTDAFPWWAAILAYGIAGTLAWRIRQHGDPMQAVAALILIATPCLAATADTLEGTRRKAASVVGCSALILALFVAWQGPPISWAIPLAMPPIVAVLIGYRGGKKRAATKGRAYLQAIARPGKAGDWKARELINTLTTTMGVSGKVPFLPVDTKYRDRKHDPDTLITSIWFTTQQRIPGDTPRDIAGFLSLPSGLVAIHDLHEDKVGLYKMNICGAKAFDFTMPQPPPLEQWPANHYPAGVGPFRRVVFTPCNVNSYTAGETRAGKTDAMLNRAFASIALGRQLVCIDLKQVDFVAVAPHCSIHADTPREALDALKVVQQLKNDRLLWMKQNGHREWPGGPDDPYVDLLVDECADLFNDRAHGKDAIAIAEDIAARGSAAGIYSHWATQHPTTDSLPRIVKVNTPVTIGLRVQDGNAARAVAGEDSQKQGFDLSPQGRLPQGRACFMAPGEGRRWVQLFKAPQRPPYAPTRGATSQAPWPAPMQPDATSATRPPSTPPTQGEQGLHAVAQPPVAQPVAQPDTDPAIDDEFERIMRTEGLTETSEQDTRSLVLSLLTYVPVTSTALANVLEPTRQAIEKQLTKLQADGLARKVTGGWIRA